MDLKSYRKSQKMSQGALALVLGVRSKSYISQIESGSRRAPLHIALRIEQWSNGALKAADFNGLACDLTLKHRKRQKPHAGASA